MIVSPEAQAILDLPLRPNGRYIPAPFFTPVDPRMHARFAILTTIAAAAITPNGIAAQASSKLNRYGNPQRLAPAPTSPTKPSISRMSPPLG